MNRILAALTVLAGLLPWSGAAWAETVVGVAYQDLSFPFIQLIRDATVEEAKSHSDVRLEITDAKSDAATQKSQVKALIDGGADAVILNLVTDLTREDVVEMGQWAAQKNTPLVFVNGQPPLDRFPVPFAIVASNEFIAGRLQMRKIAKLMDNKGEVFILRGADSASAAKDRTAGTKEVASKIPGITIVGEQTANWSRDEAQQVITKWLNAGNSADAIIANNDEMGLGAIKAYKALGKPLDGVLFASVDGTPDARQSMKDGELTLTVLQNAAGQGRGSLIDALKLIKGEAVPEYDWIPYELITNKNLDQYM